MTLGRIVRARVAGGVDFAAFGENSLDTIAIGPALVAQPGTKRPLTQLLESPGGQAATAALACARLGWRTRYAGAVGDDAAAREVVDPLARAGVGLAIVRRAGVSTRRAVVLVDEATGDRTVFESRDAALYLQPGELPDPVFTETRILLVDGSDPGQAQRALRAARAANVRTLIDVDRDGPGIRELLPLVDVVVIPEDLAATLAGTNETGRALAALGRETGAAAVVATLGAKGALGWCQGRELLAAAHPVPVVDTTGAGDAFRAGFAAGWLARAGVDPELGELLADANLVAGLNCRARGAQAGLPAQNEVPAHLRGGV
jgi:sugar/nucleoside kinase (ribokinase family)